MQLSIALVVFHRIGHSRINSTNKANLHLSFVRVVVETGSQANQISASPRAKYVMTAVCEIALLMYAFKFLLQNIESLNLPIKIGKISTTLLKESRSACNFLNQSLASQVVKSSQNAFWVCKPAVPDFFE